MRLLKSYVSFLKDEQNLTSGTIKHYERDVRCFLKTIKGYATPALLKKISASLIHQYIVEIFRSYKREKRRQTSAAIRSFLKFSYQKGYLKKNLTYSVPTIRLPKLASLPRGYPWEIVKKIVQSPNRKTHSGCRDYAVLQILASYGVRSKQIVDLKLKDIDWHAATISFHSCKGGKPLCFPLTKNVALAVINYLKKYRDNKTPHQNLFLSVRGLPRPFSGISCNNILRACHERLDFKFPHQGAHSIRHAFATNLIEKNIPIKTISDLLGHRSINTTFIYTKVNLKKLRKLARQWPKWAL
ncbi:MAG: tyrosine-type recombinase/integrase [Oligoflexia bacterium]|nr:tyrosine-type recombinase/integrase [Oligoflexia bacterium]